MNFPTDRSIPSQQPLQAKRPPRDPAPGQPHRAVPVEGHPFALLGLSPALVRAVQAEGYTEPTPVQSQVIPRALDGRDVLAGAQTGTGKTAAFVLPILQHMAEEPGSGKVRTLILTPTRELAAQIDERIEAYGRFLRIKHAVIYGGVSQRPQEEAMRQRPDILVATPGRLLDLMNQGFVKLDGITHFVLDEADRMLDMGFIHDVKRVVSALPSERQTLFFSATIPSVIEDLAGRLLEEPVRVAITPKVTTAEGVDQAVIFVDQARKRELLERLLKRPEMTRTIVFTRTKHGANRLVQQLDRAGIVALALHGNKSQGARERALGTFRSGQTPVLVATDVAARGIDVEAVSHVINYELPNIPESYVHRIGRTGRAGAVGRALSLCAPEERPFLLDIERLIKKRVDAVDEELRASERPQGAERSAAPPPRPQGFGPGGGARRRRRR